MDTGIDLASYYPNIVTRVADLLRDGFGSRIKRVYEGDPLDIPALMLPCLIVAETAGAIGPDATGLDEDTSTVKVTFLQDKRSDFGSTKEKLKTYALAKSVLEGRDPVTGQYITDSVLGIMRTKFTMGQTVVDQTVRKDYSRLRAKDELVSCEASLTFTFNELIQVPNRS